MLGKLLAAGASRAADSLWEFPPSRTFDQRNVGSTSYTIGPCREAARWLHRLRFVGELLVGRVPKGKNDDIAIRQGHHCILPKAAGDRMQPTQVNFAPLLLGQQGEKLARELSLSPRRVYFS
jgi:hypothetical protein